MKRIYLSGYVKLLALALILLQACQKGERFDTATPQIVELAFSGASTVPLEFMYDNNIVGTTIGQNNSMPNPFTLNIAKGDQVIHVREKGKTELLKSFPIDASAFQQKFGILYDDGKIYDNSIFYHLSIHPLGKDVEIYLDGKLKDQSYFGSVLSNKLTIPLDKDQTRELTVKIKGEDNVILSRSITEADADKTLKFFLAGNRPVENMELPALKDPNGMSLTFIFRPDIEFGQTSFPGGDVDLVFYQRDLMTEEVTHPDPEIRVTVPQGQSFATVELPAIPDSKFYTFDVFRKGTNEVVYGSNSPAYTVQPGLGKYGYLNFFKDLQSHFFIPGDKLVCTISAYEEFGGANFDEIFITPGAIAILNEFIQVQ